MATERTDRPERRFGVLADWSPVREYPGFRAQWFALVGSALAREVARYAFPIHVYLVTGSLALLGFVALLQLVATAVLAVGGGTVSDLFDRRLVIIVSLAIMAAATVGLLGLALTDSTSLPLIIVLGVIVTTFSLVEHPARMGAVSRLVPPTRLPSAIALTTLNFQVMVIAGPALGALIFGVAGIAGAYALQLVAFLWAIAMTFRMPRIPALGDRARSPLGMVRDSFVFVAERRLILSTFAVDLTAMILALPIGSLLPILLLEAFDLDPQTVGFMLAARGVGAVLGATLSGWMRTVGRAGTALLLTVLVYAGITMALGLAAGAMILAVPLMAAAGAVDVTSAILRNTIIQTATPDDLRGRVTAIHMLSSNGGPRIGDIRAALMAQVLGPAGAIFWGGALAVVGIALVARAFPELVAYRTPVEVEPGEDPSQARADA